MSFESLIKDISQAASQPSQTKSQIEALKGKARREGLFPPFTEDLVDSFFDEKTPGTISFKEYDKLAGYDHSRSRRFLNALYITRTSYFPLTGVRRGTVSQVVREVLAVHPDVIHVGEEHARKIVPHSDMTSKRFTDDVLPKLVKAGYKTLVMEAVPYGWNSEEKARFRKNGIISEKETPELVGHLSFQYDEGRPGTEYLLRACQRLDVEIVGGGVPHDQVIADVFAGGSVEKDPSLTGEQRAFIQDRQTRIGISTVNNTLQSATRYQLMLGNKVMIYGGAMHNDTHTPKNFAPWSIGDDLSDSTVYAALDIIVPEYATVPPFQALMALRPDNSEIHMRRVLNSWTLIYSDTPEPKEGSQ